MPVFTTTTLRWGTTTTTVLIPLGDISPGCGCEPDLVDQLVEELKLRQRGRGDTAQIQRAEETLGRLDHIETKLNLIMEHLNIPDPTPMDRQ